MATFLHLRTMARALPDVVADILDEQAVFRVRRTIFAAGDLSGQRGTLRLDPQRQAAWISAVPGAFGVANGAWGRHGWTHVLLGRVSPAILSEALFDAWQTAAPKLQADRARCLAEAIDAARFASGGGPDFAEHRASAR